jgi:hypothetical protein
MKHGRYHAQFKSMSCTFTPFITPCFQFSMKKAWCIYYTHYQNDAKTSGVYLLICLVISSCRHIMGKTKVIKNV